MTDLSAARRSADADGARPRVHDLGSAERWDSTLEAFAARR